MFCGLQAGNKYVRKARISVARQAVKSIIGKERISLLNLEIAPIESQNRGELSVISIEREKTETLTENTKMFVKKFPEFFLRKGKIKNHKVKVTIDDKAKITH